MRSVKVTVEVLGTGLQETSHEQIDTSLLEHVIREAIADDQDAARRIVDRELLKAIVHVGLQVSGTLTDQLSAWIRDVEQRVVDQPVKLTDEEVRLLKLIASRKRVRLTHMATNETEIIRKLVGAGLLVAENIGGEEFVSRT